MSYQKIIKSDVLNNGGVVKKLLKEYAEDENKSRDGMERMAYGKIRYSFQEILNVVETGQEMRMVPDAWPTE